MATKTKQAKAETTEGEATETPKAAAPAREQRNGMTRPAAGTATGRVWEIADQLSETAGAPASRKDVLAAFEAENGNPATGATQYGRWRKFYGLQSERGQKAAAPAEAEATAAE